MRRGHSCLALNWLCELGPESRTPGKTLDCPGGLADRSSSVGWWDRNRALDFERNRISVVMIRLARFGARKQPYYRIVVIEKDRARNGRSIEVIGTYNPRTSPATVDLKHERVAYWRSKGAQVSTIVEKLLTKNPAPAAVATPVEA